MWNIRKEMEMKIPFFDAMTQMLEYAKFLKDLLPNKKKFKDEVINLSHEVRIIVQEKQSSKQRSQPLQPFHEPGKHIAKGCTYRFGNSINLLPLSIANMLSFDLKSS